MIRTISKTNEEKKVKLEGKLKEKYQVLQKSQRRRIELAILKEKSRYETVLSLAAEFHFNTGLFLSLFRSDTSTLLTNFDIGTPSNAGDSSITTDKHGILVPVPISRKARVPNKTEKRLEKKKEASRVKNRRRKEQKSIENARYQVFKTLSQEFDGCDSNDVFNYLTLFHHNHIGVFSLLGRDNLTDFDSINKRPSKIQPLSYYAQRTKVIAERKAADKKARLDAEGEALFLQKLRIRTLLSKNLEEKVQRFDDYIESRSTKYSKNRNAQIARERKKAEKSLKMRSDKVLQVEKKEEKDNYSEETKIREISIKQKSFAKIQSKLNQSHSILSTLSMRAVNLVERALRGLKDVDSTILILIVFSLLYWHQTKDMRISAVSPYEDSNFGQNSDHSGQHSHHSQGFETSPNYMEGDYNSHQSQAVSNDDDSKEEHEDSDDQSEALNDDDGFESENEDSPECDLDEVEGILFGEPGAVDMRTDVEEQYSYHYVENQSGVKSDSRKRSVQACPPPDCCDHDVTYSNFNGFPAAQNAFTLGNNLEKVEIDDMEDVQGRSSFDVNFDKDGLDRDGENFNEWKSKWLELFEMMRLENRPVEEFRKKTKELISIFDTSLNCPPRQQSQRGPTSPKEIWIKIIDFCLECDGPQYAIDLIKRDLEISGSTDRSSSTTELECQEIIEGLVSFLEEGGIAEERIRRFKGLLTSPFFVHGSYAVDQDNPSKNASISAIRELVGKIYDDDDVWSLIDMVLTTHKVDTGSGITDIMAKDEMFKDGACLISGPGAFAEMKGGITKILIKSFQSVGRIGIVMGSEPYNFVIKTLLKLVENEDYRFREVYVPITSEGISKGEEMIIANQLLPFTVILIDEYVSNRWTPLSRIYITDHICTGIAFPGEGIAKNTFVTESAFILAGAESSGQYCLARNSNSLSRRVRLDKNSWGYRRRVGWYHHSEMLKARFKKLGFNEFPSANTEIWFNEDYSTRKVERQMYLEDCSKKRIEPVGVVQWYCARNYQLGLVTKFDNWLARKSDLERAEILALPKELAFKKMWSESWSKNAKKRFDNWLGMKSDLEGAEILALPQGEAMQRMYSESGTNAQLTAFNRWLDTQSEGERARIGGLTRENGLDLMYADSHSKCQGTKLSKWTATKNELERDRIKGLTREDALKEMNSDFSQQMKKYYSKVYLGRMVAGRADLVDEVFNLGSGSVDTSQIN